MSEQGHSAGVADVAASLIAQLSGRGQTVVVAESLTGGSLTAALVAVPGASAVVIGAVIAYNTAIKQSVLGVDPALLASGGAVDAEVARQMAEGVRRVLVVEGLAADYALATTGVAGPTPQDGQPPGTVFISLAHASGVETRGLRLEGDRGEIRAAAVTAALGMLHEHLQQQP
ncbi:MAG: CinA family protein [Leifsonia sp.]